MKEFPVFRISGTAYERGRQFGQLARGQIVTNLRAYERAFREGAAISWEVATAYAAQFIPWIEQYDAEIMEEIKGISEGAGLDLQDIVALNARSEIITNLGGSTSKADGCTCIAAVPPATKRQETLIGQNWDWVNLVADGLVVVEIEQPPRPTILMITEAGIVGKIGMNAKGLAVCLNFLRTSEKSVGVPIHIILRGILNSSTLPQAIRQITRLPRGTAANYLLAHREGEAVGVETAQVNYDVLYPLEGHITHTNHFVCPRIQVDDSVRMGASDTYLRMGRATKLLTAERGNIDEDDIKDIFRDHFSYPNAICRHGEAEENEEAALLDCTLFSIVMNLTTGTFELSKGQPCQSTYERYHFSEKHEIAKPIL
ncbi:C45 family autoproteolytic acyltransferase/hydolase [Brevibacillus reuszeri]|uniref:C45 family autoproteolytic acyltransferase/hydolase n=1 Tax=Brevibacillus reuszeri TaxID=54915 RepID=UPI000CCC1626|nr:C45 family peptidase [Brevibacillus reuszeri]